MIGKLVDFALGNKLIVLCLGVILLVGGVAAFRALPVEAYPDVANTWVQVITQWPGHAAEEVEQQITIPVETQMNGVPQLSSLRSSSLFGLSVVTMVFDDGTDTIFARQQALEKLTQAVLPPNVNPQLGPNYSPVGQIMFYTLESTNPQYDLMDLKSLEDWVLEKQFKSVPNVADVASFGGTTREYQVQIDPDKLVSYGLSLNQVEQALTNNNVNAGGSFVEYGHQAFNVRAIGLMRNTDDIGATLLKAQNGTPVRVRDVAVVTQGARIRLGQIGRAIHHRNGRVVDEPDVVEGIILMRKGALPDHTLEDIHAKIKQLNETILPNGVKVVPYLDRSDLVHFTTHTVMHNLTEGILLVSVILFLFLGNLRGALIVATTIPFALLFAATLLQVNHIPANLLSLGALDFGMLVDGTVVMIENILRHAARKDSALSMQERIRAATHEVQKPVFYAKMMIIVSFLPIFTLQRVEGRLFRPMAWTVAFALVGALVFSILIAPVLASIFFRNGAKEWNNPILNWVIKWYRILLRRAMRFRYVTVGGALAILAVSVYLAVGGLIGSEFLPHLDEGAIWARGTSAASTGPTEGADLMHKARLVLAKFPEVTQVESQLGRPDDGTDSSGFYNTEYFVDLKPHDQWRPQFKTKEELIAAMNRNLSQFPGVQWNFSQPIADNMEEAVSGVKGQLSVKVFGDDLANLEATADKIVGVLSKIPGVADLGVLRVIGQPNLNLVINRQAADRFGINVSDIQDAVETAVGGKPVTQILLGEERYDLVVRYQEPYRRTIEAIKNIRLLAPSGERVSIGQLTDASVRDGASTIYREGNNRYIAIKYGVRGRDLGSTVDEAIAQVKKNVPLKRGYRLEWAGEYESAKRANARLAIIVPITLLLIYFILYSMFHSFKWASLVLLTLVLAPIGGLFALYLTGTHFSVSSGVGFLALFGVAVQTGVIMVEYINQLRARGHEIAVAAEEGAVLRLRPIMMTMLVATLGLLPAATSHAIGSDSQRPFAIVIVGGLSATLLMSIFVLPTLYVWFAGRNDVLPKPEESFE
ncbi:MAG: CusA/CzcA family heavy metal efflux RND transporter [Acidobacteriota bacterium]|nr:CusA/CzcA family heavy metal efflux RND transporter [Acidobacteriota bacterium]